MVLIIIQRGLIVKRPAKKRVKLRSDGYYYPQYRWFGLWLDYDIIDSRHGSCSSVQYCMLEGAQRFLGVEHQDELVKIKRANESKIVKWSPTT